MWQSRSAIGRSRPAERFGRFLSSLVVSGQMSRGDALEALKAPLYDPKLLAEDKIFIAKKLGLPLTEFEVLVNQPVRHFSEFPNHQRKRRLAMLVYRTAKSVLAPVRRMLDGSRA